MPNLQNAKKALRVADRRRIVNDKRRKAMRAMIKDTAVLKGQAVKVVNEGLTKAYQAIDKALKRGVIKKNTASRKKSRLAKSLKPEK